MTESRTKPGVAFWATVVVVVLLVGYPLSFGPVCGFADQGVLEHHRARRLYGPLLWITSRSPTPVQRTVTRYAEWFRPGNEFCCGAFWIRAASEQRAIKLRGQPRVPLTYR